MEKDKYFIKKDLKQYTPLLHFQGDEEGACLRATEVKPALDRFVCRIVEEQGQAIPEEWKLKAGDGKESGDSGGHTSLRYKMRIQIKGKSEVNESIHKLYFANRGEDKNPHLRGVFCKDGMKVSILCTERTELKSPVSLPDGRKEKCLYNILDSVISAFFALHCFGARSSKGFGSFGVEGEKIEPKTLVNYLPCDIPALFYSKWNALSSDEDVDAQYLNDVLDILTLMKGGLNYGGEYVKGYIFQYLGERSEKALIKRDIMPCSREDSALKKKYAGYHPATAADPCVYKRAVLGLSSTFTYNCNPWKEIYRKGVIYAKPEDSDIGRFENPVHFKPHGGYLFLIPQEIPTAIFNKKFYLERKDGAGNSKDDSTLKYIPVPSNWSNLNAAEVTLIGAGIKSKDYVSENPDNLHSYLETLYAGDSGKIAKAQKAIGIWNGNQKKTFSALLSLFRAKYWNDFSGPVQDIQTPAAFNLCDFLENFSVWYETNSRIRALNTFNSGGFDFQSTLSRVKRIEKEVRQ